MDGKRQNPVAAEYARLAADYDIRWSHYVDATTNATLERLQVPYGARILDVGCGTGILLAKLARTYPHATLIGVDPVPEMLAIARRRVAPSTELHEGWAEALPFGDSTFDLVVSSSVLHYLRRPAEALAEMSRVLRPGGRLAITDWCGDFLSSRLCDKWLRLTNRAHFRTYRKRDLFKLMSDAGFPQSQVERYKIDWWWGLMTATMTKPSPEDAAL